LEPERIGEPTQQFVASIVMYDRLAHDGAETRHAVGEPFRHLPAMQREVGASRPSSHESTILAAKVDRQITLFMLCTRLGESGQMQK